MDLIIFLIVGTIGGWLAGLVLSRGVDKGLDWADFVFGILGALIGGYLFNALGFGGAGLLYSIVVAFIGAVLLTLLYRAATGRRVW